jgi:hypothetical protein
MPESVHDQAGTVWPAATWKIVGFPCPQTCGLSGYRGMMALLADLTHQSEMSLVPKPVG